MTVQPNVDVSIVQAVESTFGVAATAGGASQIIRRVSSNLNPQKDAFASNEVRVDQQISDYRHGQLRGGGSFQGELSTVSYDAALEACMRGTWTAGVNVTSNTNNTSVAIASTGIFTFGSGSLITQGVRVGDIVSFTGLGTTGAPLNGVSLRVLAMTALTLTLGGPAGTVFPTMSAQTTTFSMKVVGSKLLVGTIQRSFTIEQLYPDTTLSELYVGSRYGGFSLNAQPNAMVTIGFDVLSQQAVVLDSGSTPVSPYFTAATAQTNTNIVSAINGQMRMAGKDRAVVTGMSLNVTNNLSAPPVIGTTQAPNIFYGRTVFTGQLMAFLEDKSMIAAFLNESEVDVTCLMNDPLGGFLNVSAQRIKLGGASKTIGADGGVLAQFPFQALLQNATGYDTSSVVIQRSN